MRIISVVGYKKSGKTLLVERLVSELKKYGRVGTIKHLHGHDLNPPNTDTRRHGEAGAEVVIGITPSELVVFSKENTLKAALDELADSGMDFAVVEGFKDSSLPKIVLGDLEAPNTLKRLDKEEISSALEEIVELVLSQPEYYTLKALIKKIEDNPEISKAGAIGTFTGIVRAKSGETQTQALEFEEYGWVAGQKIKEICEDLRRKEGIIDVLIHHKKGLIGPGEDIVYIAVASSHREELFPVLREAIERVKAEVPIWKKEHTLEGEFWVHDREHK